MMFRRCLFVLAWTLVIACATRGQNVTLAKEGRIVCRIVLAEDAPELDRLSATDLADHLEQIVGERPQISAEAGDGANIFVGRTPAIEAMLGDVDWPALGPDGIVMRTVDDDIVLTGGNPRGPMNAVYSFLQDVLGCQWWTPDAASIPRQPTLDISSLNVTYRPQFEFRRMDSETLANPQFARRMRQNGWLVGYDAADHTSHTKLIPYKEHFLTNPDWFMYEPDDGNEKDEYSFVNYVKYLKEEGAPGWYESAIKHRRLPPGYCTTHPEVRKAFVEAALAHLKVDYPKLRPPKVAWVTQNDGPWNCKCERCAELEKREGSASAAWVEIGNMVAEAVEPLYPDVKVGIMAYLHTQAPPRTIKPHPKLLVYIPPLDRDHKRDAAHLGRTTENIKGWCELAKTVFIWDYDANFRNWTLPHPNYFVTPASLRFYADEGVQGVLVQGIYGTFSDMVRMRGWVNSQMMWNPNQDDRALTQKFMEGYYGAAGPHLMTYVDLLHHALNRDDKIFLSAYALSNERWLTLADLCTATRIFDQAQLAVKDDPELLFRVRRERMGVEMSWLERYDEWKETAARTGLPYLGPKDPAAALDELAKMEFGAGTYRPWAGLDVYIAQARERFAAKSE